MEDAYVAGRFAKSVLPGRLSKTHELNDAAIAARELVRHYGDKWSKAIGASLASRNLVEFKLKQDVAAATEVDLFDLVPRYQERQIRLDHQE